MGNKPQHTFLPMLGIGAYSQKTWMQRQAGKRRRDLQLPELSGGSLSQNLYLTHLCVTLPGCSVCEPAASIASEH